MARKGGKPKGITKARRERMAKALQLREGGAPYKKIASILGISEGMAFRDVRDALHEITREDAENLLTLELARLDALWIPAYAEGRKGNLKAAQTALKIHERRCRLLGLEVEHRQITVNTAESIQEAFRMIDELPLDALMEDAAE